jgi:UDP-N-acetylglucosamine 1-carboxyvinyltransferase
LDKIVIDGGHPLQGRVSISGAKNAALPNLVACLLHDGVSRIDNAPELKDVDTLLSLLEGLGARCTRDGGLVVVDASSVDKVEAPYEQVRKMRASVLVLGPLLARFGRARVSLPGGCAIGERPVDLHLKGFEALGAEIEIAGGYVNARAPQGLSGNSIYLDLPSVGATENILMAACLATGRTVIENAAREPEIRDLAECLRGMGALIEGAGSSTIQVTGVDSLGPARHRVLPDRIEAGTYMVATAITGGDVLMEGARMPDLDAVTLKLIAAGVEVRREQDGIRVRHHGELHGVDIETLPYPGFPTDLQAQFMSLMTVASSPAVVTETVFENRFMHVPELRRLGADVRVHGRSAFVAPVRRLSGASVMATDLRASASLVVAALGAEGRSEILRVYHLDRGYEHIERKLAELGAHVARVPQDQPMEEAEPNPG